MLILRPPFIRPSEITPYDCYVSRRELLMGAAAMGLAAGLPSWSAEAAAFEAIPSPLSTADEPTPIKDITSYNNYYEFGGDKGDAAANAHTLTTKPWTISVDGLVARPTEFHLEDVLNSVTLEERIYRLRCVEGWSMVIPWVGFPLGSDSHLMILHAGLTLFSRGNQHHVVQAAYFILNPGRSGHRVRL